MEEVSMKKEYAKYDEEFKKMIVNLCETNKYQTMEKKIWNYNYIYW